MTESELAKLITPTRVIELHSSAIRAHGGLDGVRQEGCVDGVIGGAISGCIYAAAEQGAGPDILGFLAHLMRGLNSSHCFNDGNKRVTWMVVDDVLLQVGLRIACEQAEAADFVRRMASERMSPPQIVAWLVEPGRIEPL